MGEVKNEHEMKESNGEGLNCPLVDNNALGISNLCRVLNGRMMVFMMRVLQCNDFTQKVMMVMVLKVFQRKLRWDLRVWDSKVKRKKKLLTGLSILNRQETKRNDKVRKKKVESGLEKVWREKGVNQLWRILRRKIDEFKADGFMELVRNWFSTRKVFGFIIKGVEKVKRRCLGSWKQYLVGMKRIKREIGKLMGRVVDYRRRMVLEKINERLWIVENKAWVLGFSRLEKIVNARGKLMFLFLFRGNGQEFEYKIRFLLKFLSSFEIQRMEKGFCGIRSFYRITHQRSLFAIQKLKILVLKRTSNLFCSVLVMQLNAEHIKFSIFFHNLALLENKNKQYALNKLNSLYSKKSFLFPAKIIINKFQQKVKNTQKTIFFLLRTHKNKLRYIESSTKLILLISRIQKFFKKSSLRSLKSFVKQKKHHQLLYKLKLYQLETLLNHKNKQKFFKLKFKHFFHWKNIYLTLPKHSNAQAKNTENLVLKIFTTLTRIKSAKQSSEFSTIKMRFLQEKSNSDALIKLNSRHIRKKSFENFREKTPNISLSPTSMKNSNLFFGSSIRMSSPHSLNPGVSSPSMLAKNGRTSSRYAFNSIKKKITDSTSYKNSGILKTIYYNDRTSLLSELEALIRK